MSPEFQQKIDTALVAFRGFARAAAPSDSGARLVQYAGVEVQGAIDVPAEDVEREVAGVIAEGLAIDWAAHGQRLYLRVYEHGGPEPTWAKVFAEEDLVDIDSI